MYIHDFFEVQKQINKDLTLDPNLNDYKLKARKSLHLHVKISDLANETKCFKYWVDENLIVNTDVVFKKYLSCLNQILSIGIDSNYDDIEKIKLKPNDYCLSDQFLNLYIDINDLIISPSKDHYITLFEDFISLGITLGFNNQDINEGLLNYC
ncbi:MAG: dUTP diphosphatase [Clostridium sp.]